VINAALSVAGRLAKVVEDSDLRGEIVIGDERDRRRDLREWCWDAGGGGGELWSDGGVFHDDVVGDDVGDTSVEGTADAGREG